MMKNFNALVIDDEPDIRELLKITLVRMNVNCLCAENLKQAKSLLNDNVFDICLTDMRLPDGDGVEFVSYAQKNYPLMPIAVITAHGNMEAAIQALKFGAFDFLSKPVDLEHLRPLIKNALNLSSNPLRSDKKLLGTSKAIKSIKEMISKLARSQAPVYISGESGVGKELVAKMIHEQGPRVERPFVPVNCGAIPHELMESEFFGHKKGSFTGAASDSEGLFLAADGGTLFLDEVAELPQNMQVKLLRAIQEKKIRPIGQQIEIPVNVRILSATHKDLNNLATEGSFRKDLYYRINVIELQVPPLRERPEDILVLIENCIQNISANSEMAGIQVTKDAKQALLEYSYPGNVRELENILERAITLCNGREITLTDLKLPDLEETSQLSEHHDESSGLDSFINIIEKEKIIEALEKSRWNKTAAAKFLGISFRALRYRLEKLGIE